MTDDQYLRLLYAVIVGQLFFSGAFVIVSVLFSDFPSPHKFGLCIAYLVAAVLLQVVPAIVFNPTLRRMFTRKRVEPVEPDDDTEQTFNFMDHD